MMFVVTVVTVLSLLFCALASARAADKVVGDFGGSNDIALQLALKE